MKLTITFLTAIIVSGYALADTGALQQLDLHSDLVGVSFEDNEKSLIITLSNELKGTEHTVIDIRRINDLEYKTRVMRYLGGLLVNHTYKFETLVVIVDGERFTYDWNRANVSLLVNKICSYAESIS